ncbi:MAG: glutaredoxin 3 [Thiomicrospira sp.]|jgi:glutaredoxin 3|nr:glutaredoxin 3 [Thiomicrospira sp.]
MPAVVVYLNLSCPYCVRATRLLDSKGVTYEVKRVDLDPQLWTEIKTRTGRSTIPQIFIGEHHVGGCDDLHAAEARGELDQLLKG